MQNDVDKVMLDSDGIEGMAGGRREVVMKALLKDGYE